MIITSLGPPARTTTGDSANSITVAADGGSETLSDGTCDDSRSSEPLV
jgi:hypothetical protein